MGKGGGIDVMYGSVIWCKMWLVKQCRGSLSRENVAKLAIGSTSYEFGAGLAILYSLLLVDLINVNY